MSHIFSPPCPQECRIPGLERRESCMAWALTPFAPPPSLGCSPRNRPSEPCALPSVLQGTPAKGQISPSVREIGVSETNETEGCTPEVSHPLKRSMNLLRGLHSYIMRGDSPTLQKNSPKVGFSPSFLCPPSLSSPFSSLSLFPSFLFSSPG